MMVLFRQLVIAYLILISVVSVKDCDLVCLNGGTLNLAECTCSCIRGFTRADCALDCTTKTDPWQCTNSYDATYCPLYANVQLLSVLYPMFQMNVLICVHSVLILE